MPLDRYSISSVPLQLNAITTSLGTGTGFFYEKDGAQYLVSNWHVLAGRNPTNGQARHQTGTTPLSVSFPACVEGRLGHWRDEQLNLTNGDGEPLWRQHRQHGQDVDIAVLRINNISNGNEIFPINTAACANDMAIMVGMDVYILGFPLGQTHTACLPVWKRASIATEPDVDLDTGERCFLVDTATRKGMSGSPVIAKSVGSAFMANGDMSMGGIFYKPTGVYSGRYVGEALNEMQLGKVWRWDLIDEIIDDGVEGSFELR